MIALNLNGERFGRLVVIERAGTKISKKNVKTAMWKCKCDCGKITFVSSHNLRCGDTKSCGCLQEESRYKANKKHSMSNSKLYYVHWAMINRCYNKKDAGYKNYGARGIEVCENWKNSREEFFQWALSNGYHEWLSLDRIDNSKSYSPENCKWSTRKEQNRNTRANFNVTAFGDTKTLAEWCEIMNLPYSTIFSRIKYENWDCEKALSTPVRKIKKNNLDL